MSIEFKGINANKPGEIGARREAQEKRETPRSGPAQAATAGTADTVTFTATAARMRELESTLGASAPVDNSRVADVHAAVSAGSYAVDPERIAEKLIAFEQALSGRDGE